MKKPEILSPAGNMDALKAAVIAGCDAVYLGGYIFGARSFASNFSEDEIIEAVKYCHGYGVKLYVTVNTLIYEKEVETFLKYVEFLYMNNVDAIIVQDIGMADLIRMTFKDFEVHASTQMHIHNIEGVRLAKKMGLKRVVLARETNFEDVKNIVNNVDIELEIFVHGALCISYSGQCLMSSLIGNRSGNRGTCAGSCRQQYDVLDSHFSKVNSEKYNLSTKDLNTIENIGELIDIGIDSLKIEGRMKSPSYVYLVTKIYRMAVDSYIKSRKVDIDYKLLDDLSKTFNRLYTKGFLFNISNDDLINTYRPNHLGVELGKVIDVSEKKVKIKLLDDINVNDGIRFVSKNKEYGQIISKMYYNNKSVIHASKNDIVIITIKENIPKDSKLLKTSDYLLNKDIEKIISQRKQIPIKGKIELNVGDFIKIYVTDGINEILLKSSSIVLDAIKAPISKERVRECLLKTGDTIFKFEDIDVEMSDNVFVSIKDINELRRNALTALYQLRLKIIRQYKKTNYKREVQEFKNERIKSIYIDDLKLLDKVNKDYDRIYLDNINEKSILRLSNIIHDFKSIDKHLLVSELGSVNYYKDFDTDVNLNVVNSYSVALLNNLGAKRVALSYELDEEQIKNLIEAYKKRYRSMPNLGIIVYAKEQVMTSKFNLLKYYNIDSDGYLKDRFSNLYKIRVKDDVMYIYNYKPRNFIKNINKYYNMGINEVRCNIVDEEDLNFI